MSSWFDKLLEDLQRRQEESDARREGRPFERRERNVTPIDEGRRGRGNGADGGGPGKPGGPPVVADDLPWRRWLRGLAANGCGSCPSSDNNPASGRPRQFICGNQSIP